MKTILSNQTVGFLQIKLVFICSEFQQEFSNFVSPTIFEMQSSFFINLLLFITFIPQHAENWNP